MMEKQEIIDSVRDFLDNDDWKYEYDESRNFIQAGVSLKCKLQSVKLYFIFNDTGYTCTARCAMKADENTRASVVEFLTRANYGLRNGNFEMDMRDGEVGYKTFVSAKGLDTLPEEIIKDSIYIPVIMFDRYGDGMAALMFGFSDPETEINRIEQK